MTTQSFLFAVALVIYLIIAIHIVLKMKKDKNFYQKVMNFLFYEDDEDDEAVE